MYPSRYPATVKEQKSFLGIYSLFYKLHPDGPLIIFNDILISISPDIFSKFDLVGGYWNHYILKWAHTEPWRSNVAALCVECLRQSKCVLGQRLVGMDVDLSLEANVWVGGEAKVEKSQSQLVRAPREAWTYSRRMLTWLKACALYTLDVVFSNDS